MIAKRKTKSRITLAAAATIGLALSGSVAASAAPSSSGPAYTVHTILSGSTLSHSYMPAGSSAASTEPLSKPDDITRLGDHIFVGFQNGVGPQGEASTDGNLNSTIVELTTSGDPVGQWDVVGKADGVTADPAAGDVIVTVNEDGHSSLYTIDPSAAPSHAVTHYSYSEALPHFGGTDGISISHGQILISASAPGATGVLAAPQPTYPAVYAVTLDRRSLVAEVRPRFYDESPATVANAGAQYGQTVSLGLTDPDSSGVVPHGARFGGDFMLTSQGDQQQIFLGKSRGHTDLSVLSLSQAVDDTAWPTQHAGTLYSTDSTNDSVDTVTGPFQAGQPLVIATPCGSNSAPATCPGPGFPVNYLATLDTATGQVSAVVTEGAAYTPQGGLLFVAK